MSDIPELAPEEMRGLILRAVGEDGWSWKDLLEAQILVLALATLVGLAGALYGGWSTADLVLLYAIEVVAVALCYAARAALIWRSADALLGTLIMLGIGMAFVFGTFVFHAKYDLVQAFHNVRWAALGMAALYVAHAVRAVRQRIDPEDTQEDLREVYRLAFISYLYIGWGIVPILFCVMFDQNFGINGIVPLVLGRFFVEAILRSRLNFD